MVCGVCSPNFAAPLAPATPGSASHGTVSVLASCPIIVVPSPLISLAARANPRRAENLQGRTEVTESAPLCLSISCKATCGRLCSAFLVVARPLLTLVPATIPRRRDPRLAQLVEPLQLSQRLRVL